jgi:hypothetical protein
MARPRRGRSGPPARPVTKQAVRKDLLAFVEGARTEEDYLVHFHRIHRADVNLRIDPFRGAPRQLVERAAEAKRKSERGARKAEGRAYDEVWCVFDIDEHPLLNEVETMARDNGIRLAVSSPCLELWFVLHFENQTAYIDRDAAQRRASQLLGCGKSLSGDALAQLERAHDQARARAQALDAKHRGDGSSIWANPSTGAWKLVDSIRAS